MFGVTVFKIEVNLWIGFLLLLLCSPNLSVSSTLDTSTWCLYLQLSKKIFLEQQNASNAQVWSDLSRLFLLLSWAVLSHGSDGKKETMGRKTVMHLHLAFRPLVNYKVMHFSIITESFLCPIWRHWRHCWVLFFVCLLCFLT